RGDEFYCCILGNGACPLHIQRGLSFVVAVGKARVRPVDDKYRIIDWQPRVAAESADILHRDINTSQHGDALSATVHSLVQQGINVINRVPILRRKKVRSIACREVRESSYNLRRTAKIMQRYDSMNNRGQSLRNLCRGHISVMRL